MSNHGLGPSAEVEGIHSQIKVFKRKAFGFRDMGCFKLKI
ncbi:MAG: transposase [Deltaproteobacteria bacterium]|nr:transposase [Deltaproteobacteria bacterium]